MPELWCYLQLQSIQIKYYIPKYLLIICVTWCEWGREPRSRACWRRAAAGGGWWGPARCRGGPPPGSTADSCRIVAGWGELCRVITARSCARSWAGLSREQWPAVMGSHPAAAQPVESSLQFVVAKNTLQIIRCIRSWHANTRFNAFLAFDTTTNRRMEHLPFYRFILTLFCIYAAVQRHIKLRFLKLYITQSLPAAALCWTYCTEGAKHSWVTCDEGGLGVMRRDLSTFVTFNIGKLDKPSC